jgi:hypothetical protein
MATKSICRMNKIGTCPARNALFRGQIRAVDASFDENLPRAAAALVSGATQAIGGVAAGHTSGSIGIGRHA